MKRNRLAVFALAAMLGTVGCGGGDDDQDGSQAAGDSLPTYDQGGTQSATGAGGTAGTVSPPATGTMADTTGMGTMPMDSTGASGGTTGGMDTTGAAGGTTGTGTTP